MWNGWLVLGVDIEGDGTATSTADNDIGTVMIVLRLNSADGSELSPFPSFLRLLALTERFCRNR